MSRDTSIKVDCIVSFYMTFVCFFLFVFILSSLLCLYSFIFKEILNEKLFGFQAEAEGYCIIS